MFFWRDEEIEAQRVSVMGWRTQVQVSSRSEVESKVFQTLKCMINKVSLLLSFLWNTEYFRGMEEIEVIFLPTDLVMHVCVLHCQAGPLYLSPAAIRNGQGWNQGSSCQVLSPSEHTMAFGGEFIVRGAGTGQSSDSEWKYHRGHFKRTWNARKY